MTASLMPCLCPAPHGYRSIFDIRDQRRWQNQKNAPNTTFGWRLCGCRLVNYSSRSDLYRNLFATCGAASSATTNRTPAKGALS